MFGTFSTEGYVDRIIQQRGGSAEFIASLAKLYCITGASHSRIAMALRGTNPFTIDHEPLRQMVMNLEDYLESMEPVPVLLKNPQLIKRLVDEYIQKKNEEQALIISCFVIEFDTTELFAGFVDGEVQRTRDTDLAVVIKDEQTARAAASMLDTCKVVQIRRKVAESKLAKNLQDVGFKQENANVT